jgi:hypothetical protein
MVRGSLLSLLSGALVLLALPTTTAAGTLQVKNGRPLRVLVAGQPEMGVGLRSARGPWQLVFARRASGKAELVDVTPGVLPQRVHLRILRGRLVLPRHRFAPGHVYRVSATLGASRQHGIVYLSPARGPGRPVLRPSRLRFSSAAVAAPDGELVTVSKGDLWAGERLAFSDGPSRRAQARRPATP